MLSDHDIQEDLDIKLIKLVDEELIDLSLLEKLLIDGADPNVEIKKIVNGMYKHSENNTNKFGITEVKFRPLHLVKNKEEINLLLKYGSNPNLQACSGSLVKKILTPIEYAANSNEYLKVVALASFSPCIIRTEIINNTLKIILNIEDLHYSDEQRMAADILIQKSGDLRKGCDPIRIAFNNEREEIIKHMMLLRSDLIPSLPHFLGRIKNIELRSNLKKIQEENFERYIQLNYVAMSWIVLSQGHSQNENKLSLLPYEILLNIMSILCDSNEFLPPRFFNFYAEISSKEETMKVAAFIKIYFVMNECDTSLLKSHEFLEKNKSVSPIRLIRKIQDKIYNDPDGITTVAWHLACQHYHNCSSKNVELIKKLNKWCVSNDAILKMTPNFISFFDSFQNERREILNEKIISCLNEFSYEDTKMMITSKFNCK